MNKFFNVLAAATLGLTSPVLASPDVGQMDKSPKDLKFMGVVAIPTAVQINQVESAKDAKFMTVGVKAALFQDSKTNTQLLMRCSEAMGNKALSDHFKLPRHFRKEVDKAIKALQCDYKII